MKARSPGMSWPRVALWGRFDVARFGELLLPRIHEAELRRRLPGARVLPYSPLGPDHPVALDGGLTPLRLGTWSPMNAARLAAVADAIIVAGSDVLATDEKALGADYGLSAEDLRRRRLSGFFLEGAQPQTPTAWSAAGVPFEFGRADATRLRGVLQNAAYLSVRDDTSRQRLARAGVKREVAVVPDPVLLASRVFEPAVLARRLDYLRLMGWFPPEGAPVVVQGTEMLVAHAEAVATVITKALAGRVIPILLLETEPADGSGFVEALMPRLHRVFRVPSSVSLVDILAVFSGARCFVGDSVHGNMAALAFGVPFLSISLGAIAPALATLGNAAAATVHPADADAAVADLLGQARADGPPASITARLETHFDALADFVDRAQADRVEREAKPRSRMGIALSRSLQDAELRLDATREAWEARSEQVTALRLQLADRLEPLESRLGTTTEDRDRLAAELQASRQEAASLRTLRAFSQAEQERLEGDLGSASKEIASVRNQLQTAEEQAASLRSQLRAALAEGQRLAEAKAYASRHIAEQDVQLALRLGELEAMRAEFVRFTNLRLFRYTTPLRRLYAALRRFLGLTRG